MLESQALAAFGALSQETRLRIVRMLVRAGPDGMAAGAVATAAGVGSSNVSFHLKELERAGLVASRREARSIIYSAAFPALAGLVGFLMRDCCGGHPEICSPALAAPCGERTGGAGLMDVVIYHNPDCGTSRNALALIRHAGVEPHVVEYLKTPPSRALLRELIDRAGLTVRDALREKGTPYAELGLGDPGLSDEALLDAMMAHPILINRPFVVSPKGVRLCRPSERVLDLVPPPAGAFTKEDGERVLDNQGRRVGAP